MKHITKGSVEYKYLGQEPKDFNKAVNWYALVADKKDYETWFKTYCSKNKITGQIPKEFYGRVPTYISVVARFLNLNRANDIPEASLKRFEDFMKSYTITHKTDKFDKSKMSIQEKMRLQIINICTVIDIEIDNLLENPKTFVPDENILSQLSNQKEYIAKAVTEFVQRTITDIEANDEFSKEGYGYLSKEELKIFLDYLKTVRKLTSSIKTIRKPRKRKETPLYLKVKAFDTLDTYKELNLVQDDITKIPGASAVIMYNVKNRELTLLISEAGGFDAKGKSILNVHESSYKIKLRKPDIQIPTLKLNSSRTINPIKKRIDEIKSVHKETSARVNKDTIILKVL